MSRRSRSLILLLAAAACSDATPTTPGKVPTEPGAIRVLVETLGSALDPDGYTVVLDSSGPRNLGIHDSLTLNDLMEGPHSVRLGDLASTCELKGTNPYMVAVHPSQVSPVPFQVICQPPGDLVVTIATSGSPADSDGYSLTLRGRRDTAVVALPSNGAVTVPALRPGVWSVALTGVASNCQASTSSRVQIDSGATTSLGIDVQCAAPPPSGGVGRITVTVSTTAVVVPAPSSYLVSLDGNPGINIASSGSVTFNDVPVGIHRVQLRVASYCFGGFLGAPPLDQAVVVPAGGSAVVGFHVVCLP